MGSSHRSLDRLERVRFQQDPAPSGMAGELRLAGRGHGGHARRAEAGGAQREMTMRLLACCSSQKRERYFVFRFR